MPNTLTTRPKDHRKQTPPGNRVGLFLWAVAQTHPNITPKPSKDHPTITQKSSKNHPKSSTIWSNFVKIWSQLGRNFINFLLEFAQKSSRSHWKIIIFFFKFAQNFVKFLLKFHRKSSNIRQENNQKISKKSSKTIENQPFLSGLTVSCSIFQRGDCWISPRVRALQSSRETRFNRPAAISTSVLKADAQLLNFVRERNQ